ncbi:MAG TPA: hypothetical protein VN818_07555 [Gammaproteobacteria bacterium]|nr:hypothetical protein [Gammaproteobacteria bacterium]
MTTYGKIAADAGDQYLAAISQAQENFINAIGMSMAWAPAAPVATALPADFPTPQEMIGVSFGFAQKLLKQQHDFAEKLVAATETRTEPTSAKSAVSPKSRSSASN